MNKHPGIIPTVAVIFMKFSFLLQCHLQSIEKKKKRFAFYSSLETVYKKEKLVGKTELV